MKTIPMLELTAQYATIRAEVREAIEREIEEQQRYVVEQIREFYH